MAIAPVLALLAGCNPLAPAPTVQCNDVPQATCERMAAQLIATHGRLGTTIIGVSVSQHDGVRVDYADGTSMVAIP